MPCPALHGRSPSRTASTRSCSPTPRTGRCSRAADCSRYEGRGAMSSSNVMEPAVAANCRLEVSAGLTNVEIVVTDGLFREVARGTGHVSLPHIPPGLYKIEARAGGTTESRFVSLKPGDEVSEEVARVHDVPTMAPVYGGVTDREPHHAAATRGTIAVRDAAGPSAALVVLIRTLRGGKPHPLSVNQLSLVD